MCAWGWEVRSWLDSLNHKLSRERTATRAGQGWVSLWIPDGMTTLCGHIVNADHEELLDEVCYDPGRPPPAKQCFRLMLQLCRFPRSLKLRLTCIHNQVHPFFILSPFCSICNIYFHFIWQNKISHDFKRTIVHVYRKFCTSEWIMI